MTTDTPAIVKPTREDYRAIESLEDAMALAAQMHGSVVEADQELGDGFTLINDKKSLIGVPMVFLEWDFHAGDFGTFVTVRAVTRVDGVTKKFIFNDGSTGIRETLQEFTAQTGRRGGLIARHGLRVSEYEFTNDKGETSPAETFYIDTSA